jgi:hypothetical protein
MAKKIFLIPALLISGVSQTVAQATILGGELSAPSTLHSLIGEKNPITIEVGLEYLHTDIPGINNVVVENPQTSTVTSPKYGNVDSSYPDVFAQTIKAQIILDPASKWSVSLKTYLPLNSLAQLDTGYIYQPEFVLYRAEAQRPRILLASGIDLNPDWRIGVAADIGFSVSAQANVFLQSGSGTYSDQRLVAKLKPTLVPQVSLQYLNYTFAVRGENKAPFDLGTAASARVFGSVNAAVDYSYISESAAYFQPWEFELSGKTVLSDVVKLKWGASYQLWSGYQARAALIQNSIQNNCNGNAPCSGTFSPSLAPSSKGRNLIVPEAGFEFQVGDNRYEIGYRYKDTIFKDLPTENGNYLDPPRHDVMLGVTFPTKAGWEWSLNAQVSRLVSQNVVKSDTGEIGAPGYTASGWLYGGGAHVAIPFNAN